MIDSDRADQRTDRTSRPSTPAVAVAAAAGLANVAVVFALYARADYPALELSLGVASLAVLVFTAGFVPVLVSMHTRLYSPAIGFVAVLAGAVYLELTTPSPEWSELGGHIVVDGPFHVSSYANAWSLWIALTLFAGVVEFAIRRGYRVADRSLRHLPEFPLSWRTIGRTVVGTAALVGVATVLIVPDGPGVSVLTLVIFTAVAAAVAVPLAALLSRGLLSPIGLFALLVPYFLLVEVFTSTDSPVHLFLFGPYAIVLAVAGLLEATIRSRLRDWNGGRFAR